METENTERLNVELLNTKGKLIRNILAIAGILLTVIFFLYPRIFGEDNGISSSYVTIKAPRIPSKKGSRVNGLFKNIKADSTAMKKLGKYIEGGIPASFYKFSIPAESQYLTLEEKLRFKKIKENIDEVESILCTNTRGYKYSIDYIQDWYKFLSEIRVANDRKEKLKNIEITVSDGYYSELLDAEFDGIYVDSKVDSMKEFSNSKPILIDEINPNEIYNITLWSESPISGIYTLNVNYEGGSEEITMPLFVTTNSTFDRIITFIVTGSKFIQLLLYIAVPIGLYVIFKQIKKAYYFLIGIISAK